MEKKKYEERVKRIFKKHDNVLNLEKHLEKCRYHNQSKYKKMDFYQNISLLCKKWYVK